jgi:hypothetical protein
MADIRIERGTCRFVAQKHEGGRPTIAVQFFHGSMSLLNHATLSLNLLGSLTLEDAMKLADTLNEAVLDASVMMSSEHPMFAGRVLPASTPS